MTTACALVLSRRAGLSGLFLLCAALTMGAGSIATAAPLVLEVTRATAGSDQRTNEPIISITLSEASKRAFGELTAANVGAAMELRIDGKAVMKPIIRDPILGGMVQISGGFTASEARDIAQRLSAGSAKIEVEIVKG
jgi:preprotein translocase subunit SecD